ncbi:DUF805 domain-containing protein [Parvularcula maris]|uniref:DUF805 domain-containing protein n=1 Tax=Parvularcula maris TaxID=2965077 RepID=A0A9X2L7C8_9PROT|nr:DUF805 domain-containing protein [Parvularcula maris]MCQ8184415.1 DUF805 domain-containing protein [Parvularcula maris]
MERLRRLYLSPEGRIDRRGLALYFLAPFFAVMLITDISNSPALTVLLMVLVAWPLFVAGPWKRLHDMGRSGRWNLVFYAFYVLGFAFFFGEYAAAEGGWSALFDGKDPVTTDDQLSASGLGGFSTILIFLPIHLFWLYLIPSQRGDNRYGPAPNTSE